LLIRVQEAINAAEQADMELFEARMHVSKVFYMVQKSGFRRPPLTPIWEHMAVEYDSGEQNEHQDLLTIL
jgi:hypothetical protein